ncbi:MAG: acyl-CoA thioesterase-2 [Hyphomicrobiaceae bacterium]|jgi:acyl-CoA thioesterase-2
MPDAHHFLGLQATHNPHRWVLPVASKICVHRGFLFGGCGLAAAIAALEATTKRPVVWAAAQYLSFTRPPAVLDIDVVVPVEGHHNAQARAVGHVGDKEILTVNAALGTRELAYEGTWATMPQVPDAASCEPVPSWPDVGETIHTRVELRAAAGRFGKAQNGAPSPDGRSAMWARIPEGLEVSAAMLAVLADWMPSGIGNAIGRWAGGNSLDNTIRIVRLVPTTWVLCDIQVHAVAGGFGHGRVHLWAEDGTLLATASQSVIVRLHDSGEPTAPAASGAVDSGAASRRV